MTFQVTGKTTVTFIHVPKTAGTSITEWFRLMCVYPPNGYTMRRFCDTKEHWGVNEVMREVSDLGYTFAVVRNPWDYAVSLYSHLTQKMPVVYKEFEWLKDVSFNDWILNIDIYPNTFISPYTLSSNQCSWIDNTVDVLKYESLEEDFKRVQQVVGNTLPLPIKNISQRTHYVDYYTEESKKRVSEIFAEDIDRFKYRF
jgi:hypothetical protein